MVTPHVSGSTTTNKYGFTGAGDSPGPLLDASNVVVEQRHTISGQQHDPRPLRQAHRHRRRTGPRLQQFTVSRSNIHGHVNAITP
jgi:hypothetical protein